MQDEVLGQLAATPRTLAHLVAETGEEAFDAPGPGGGWSLRTLLAHFRDAEVLEFRLALERVVAEESPEVRFLAGDEWEARRSRLRDRKDQLLADFALQRQATLAFARWLTPEDLARTARRGGRTFTAGDLLGMLLRHDREHIAEVESRLGETLAEVLERRARRE